MGRRASFEPAQREWITDQLRRNQEAVRSREVWSALYSAFLDKFPNASDVRGELITLSRFKNHAKHRESRQEGELVKRALAHLRRHEIHEQDHDALKQMTRKMASTDEDADFEVRVIKSEPGDQAEGEVDTAEDAHNEGEYDAVPRPPKPLLRTRATASAIRAEQDEQHDEPDSAMAPPPATAARPRGRLKNKTTKSRSSSGVVASSTDGVEAPRKRLRLSTSATSKPVVDAKAVAAKGTEADEWKAKYEAEKATSDSLQARLTQALALVKAQERQLQRQETTGSSSLPSPSNSGTSALTFTVNVNVDVFQNGQLLRTTARALHVDANVPSPA